MDNIKIGIKLLAGFLSVAILTAGMGIYSKYNLNRMDRQNNMMRENGLVPLSLLTKTAEQAMLMLVTARDFKLAKTQQERDIVVKQLEAYDDTLNLVIGQQIQLAISNDVKDAMGDLIKDINIYSKEMHNFAAEAKTKCPPPGECLVDFPEAFNKARSNFMAAGNKGIGLSIASVNSISDDISKTMNMVSTVSTVVMVLVLIASFIIGVYMTISMTRPINLVVGKVSKIADGDMTIRMDLNRGDEIGILGKALDNFVERLQGIMKGLRINSDTIAGASEELSSVSRQMASGAEETVAQSNTVASTTEEMAVNINAMASGAEEASVNANEVASAAEQMSVNMNTIASAIEEMSASINQIAGNTGEVRSIATEATGKASNATSVMNKLGTAAKEIGQVTDVIKKIADKTNLLALNATIEAASAGEAGKGFAVVAGEIKELANQSAKSADDIAQRIEGIQNGTNNAVEVISDVSEIIGKINQSVEAIAGHVDQQTKASNEIANNVAQANTGAKRVASAIGEVAKGTIDVSRNAGEAAKGATDVSGNVVNMSQVAKECAQGASQVTQNAGDLAKIASELKQTVSKFRV